MKTKRMKMHPVRRLFYGCSVFAAVFVVASSVTSCHSDDSIFTLPLLSLSKYTETVAIGDTVVVDINLRNASTVSTIKAVKAIDGKDSTPLCADINVTGTTFPYTFKHEIENGDEKGILVYSFLAKDATQKLIDASDLVMTVNIAQIPLLLKYDWKLISQIIQGEDYVEADMKDDIYRFNSDLTWQLDWGTVFSNNALETLYSTCSWQPVMNGSKVDSLYMIKYNVFSPTVPIVTKYKVIQLENRKMILESRQDLSFLPGYAEDEKVCETYEPVSKTDDFTPYRGSNPDSYYIESCNPGSY